MFVCRRAKWSLKNYKYVFDVYLKYSLLKLYKESENTIALNPKPLVTITTPSLDFQGVCLIGGLQFEAGSLRLRADDL